MNLKKNLKISVKKKSRFDCDFVLSPLSRGLGVTFGNLLRRTLLSALPSAAVIGFKISGAESRFSSIDGVLESSMEIALRLKSMLIRLQRDTDDLIVVKSQIKGLVSITAGDIIKHADVQPIDPTYQIATVTGNLKAPIEFEIYIKKGFGYSSAERNRGLCEADHGFIPISSSFVPILNTGFEIREINTDSMHAEELILNVQTNGSITPVEAMKNVSSEIVNIVSSISDSLMNESEDEIDHLSIQKKSKKFLIEVLKFNRLSDLRSISEVELQSLILSIPKNESFASKLVSELKESGVVFRSDSA